MEVVLAEGTALLSKLVKYATKSRWSHSALRYSYPEQDWMVHSFLVGVVPDWANYFFGHYKSTVRYQVLFDSKVADKALDNIVKTIGHKPYDYLGLLGAGIVLLLRSIGVTIKNPLSSKNAYFCSELLVVWMLECNKIKPDLQLKEFDPEVVTPADLEEYFKSNPQYFQEVK